MRRTLMPLFGGITLFIGIIGLTWFAVLMLYHFMGWTYTFNPVIR